MKEKDLHSYSSFEYMTTNTQDTPLNIRGSTIFDMNKNSSVNFHFFYSCCQTCFFNDSGVILFSDNINSVSFFFRCLLNFVQCPLFSHETKELSAKVLTPIISLLTRCRVRHWQIYNIFHIFKPYTSSIPSSLTRWFSMMTKIEYKCQ